MSRGITMEEEKSIKIRKTIKKVTNIISYAFITILMIIAAFLILYVICGQIAKKRNENPPFALYTIISPSMEPNIKVFDVVFVKKTNVKKLKEGDIITFYSTNTFFGNTPITHRIVEILKLPDGEIAFRVKGDANSVPDEEKVIPNNIIGKVMFKVPKLGKIQYYLASKKGWIIAILVPSLLILGYDVFKIIRLLLLKRKLNSYNTENKETIDQIENERKQEIINSQINNNVIQIINDDNKEDSK
jgi:signal peptidase